MFKQNYVENESDAELIIASLAGDKHAFCKIVSRYQTLLCSISYSILGNLAASEDVAQDAFVEAWKKLDTLQDHHKLKAWLCAILRFKATNYSRKEAKYSQQAVPEKASEQCLENDTIHHQHERLMWNVLQQLDPIYREPLILFYREQQSTENVALHLGISVDSAKQRLSRGRKLLKNGISNVVEQGLKQTCPSIAFTSAIFSIISTLPTPVKAATASASVMGTAKSGGVWKLVSILAVLASFAGLISTFFGLRAGLAQARTSKEKRFTIGIVAGFMSIVIIYVAVMLLLKHQAITNPDNALTLNYLANVSCIAFGILFTGLTVFMLKAQKKLRQNEQTSYPQACELGELKSTITVLGLPLYHFQFSSPKYGDPPAHGWIALGSHAKGGLFAFGAYAIAPIAVGIVSVGGLSIGAVGIGIFSIGTLAIGALAFGSSAIGLKVYAAFNATGWNSAMSGGFASAYDAAVAPIAFAKQVNNQLAYQLTNLNQFTQWYEWVLIAMAFIIIIPSIWHSNQVRKRANQVY